MTYKEFLKAMEKYDDAQRELCVHSFKGADPKTLAEKGRAVNDARVDLYEAVILRPRREAEKRMNPPLEQS